MKALLQVILDDSKSEDERVGACENLIDYVELIDEANSNFFINCNRFQDNRWI